MVLNGSAGQARSYETPDIALAVAVMALWGVNFVVIATGLEHFPPLLFNALRFTLAAFPAVFLVAGRRCRGAGSWQSG